MNFLQNFHTENATPPELQRFENFEAFQLHMEQVYKDFGKVSGILDNIQKGSLSTLDIAFGNTVLSKLSYGDPVGYRSESNSQTQQNLKLRCEGILSTIWEKIVAFWNWVLNSITKLFGGTPEVTDKDRETAIKAVKIMEANLPEAKVKGLSKLRDVIGGGNLQSSRVALKDIGESYQAVTMIAKELFKLFEKFNGSSDESIVSVLDGKHFLTDIRRSLLKDGIAGFAIDLDVTVFYLGKGKAFFPKEGEEGTVALKEAEIERKVYYEADKEISLTVSEISKLLEVLRTTTKNMAANSDFMEKNFRTQSSKFKTVLEKISKEPMESAYAKNKLKIIKEINQISADVLKCSSAFHDTLIKLLQAEGSMIVKIAKTGVKSDSLEEIKRKMDDPNNNETIYI